MWRKHEWFDLMLALFLTDVCHPRKLQQNVTDKSQLRYLTGEWFYETKQLRHQERIHGSEIIWASMKRTHKPMTICKSSQRYKCPHSIQIGVVYSYFYIEYKCYGSIICKHRYNGGIALQTYPFGSLH